MSATSPHTHFDFGELSARERYKLLIGTVIPRPIAFVTTLSKDGRRNAGPFSFFNVLTHDPAILAIGVENYADGRMKDIACKLLVIGAGPGGYVCAIRAGQLGIDTVIVE